MISVSTCGILSMFNEFRICIESTVKQCFYPSALKQVNVLKLKLSAYTNRSLCWSMLSYTSRTLV